MGKNASKRGEGRLASAWPAFIALTVFGLTQGCSDRGSSSNFDLKKELALLNESRAASADSPPPEPIARFCGDCHPLPKPDRFEREVWYDEIEKGFEFYARSGRSDLRVPAFQDVLHYYRAHAPATIDLSMVAEVDAPWQSRFEQEQVDWREIGRNAPAISSIRWTTLLPDKKSSLIVTDMRDGSVNLLKPAARRTQRTLIARLDNPARVTPCDLNEDGISDLLVADLGSMYPYDHSFGKVAWLKGLESGEFETSVIADRIGRVADVSVGNLSGDEKLDLVVAEFGHRTSGGIRLFTNVSEDSHAPRFMETTLDIRPGTLQVPICDWDEDGSLDFASAISQEFESVELFLGSGRKFNRQVIWKGNDLTFGLVGIEVVDLDRDGDQDILFANGDTFDNNFANDSHGVQWLENQGNLAFRYHRLATFIGAYRAVATDLDSDGDLDVLAVANLPTTLYPASLRARDLPSILLLENSGDMRFQSRVLEIGTPRRAALEVGDFDGDGKTDFAVGALLFGTDPTGSLESQLPCLTIWWQR